MNQQKKSTNRLKEEAKLIEQETKKQLLTYIVSALGLIAGLAWNEAIKTIIERIYPLERNDILAKLIYAVVVTIFVIFVGIILNSLLKNKERK
jgi:uncharacterized membrane protein